MSTHCGESGFKARWVYRILTLALLPIANAMGEEGTAYWGSFGEGAGQLECVVFRGEDSGQILGFDEESETGLFSTELVWGEENSFSFGSLSVRRNEFEYSSGVGLLDLSVDNPSPGFLLSGKVEGADLDFEAYRKTPASYRYFELEGSLDASLRLVVGADGLCYAFYVDENGVAWGGPASVEEAGRVRFVTREGTEFSVSAQVNGSSIGSYRNRDGEMGRLYSTPENSTSGDSEDGENRSILVDFSGSKGVGVGSPGFHFILEGEGVSSVAIQVGVDVESLDSERFRYEELGFRVFEMDAEGEYVGIFRSPALRRSKSKDGGLGLSGAVDVDLSAGVYLVQLYGSRYADLTYGFSVVVPVSEGAPELINASSLYQRGGSRDAPRLGFAFDGQEMRSVLLRVVGPSLRRFDVGYTSANPSMSALKADGVRWKNEDWWNDGQRERVAGIAEALGAYAFEEDGADAALALTLEPSYYEVVPDGQVKAGEFEVIELYFGD